ncbi:hypothetical protein BCR41DRAFT_344967, partial [Lobosporangium transversale]
MLMMLPEPFFLCLLSSSLLLQTLSFHIEFSLATKLSQLFGIPCLSHNSILFDTSIDQLNSADPEVNFYKNKEVKRKDNIWVRRTLD